MAALLFICLILDVTYKYNIYLLNATVFLLITILVLVIFLTAEYLGR